MGRGRECSEELVREIRTLRMLPVGAQRTRGACYWTLKGGCLCYVVAESLVTLLFAGMWRAEYVPNKLSDRAKDMSKLSVDSTVRFLLATYGGRDKMRERLLNKKEPGLVSFENPQSPKTAQNAKI